MKKLFVVSLFLVLGLALFSFYKSYRNIGDNSSESEYGFIEIKEMNIGLKLPSNLSDLGTWKTELLLQDPDLIKSGSASGNKYCFNNQEEGSDQTSGVCSGSFSITSPSYDFVPARGSHFDDYTGYKIQNGKYYTLFPVSEEINFESTEEIVNDHGVKILKITGITTRGEEGFPQTHGTPGESNVGAIINTNNKNYPGITITMELSEELTIEKFDQILSTIKFIK